MHSPHIEIFPGRRSGYCWRLRARNGRIIAIGGEAYTRQRDAIRAARRVLDIIGAALFGHATAQIRIVPS